MDSWHADVDAENPNKMNLINWNLGKTLQIDLERVFFKTAFISVLEEMKVLTTKITNLRLQESTLIFRT